MQNLPSELLKQGGPEAIARLGRTLDSLLYEFEQVRREIKSITGSASGTGVTNGNLHDHNGGDGAQIAYSTLSGIPSTFTPAAHGNAAHTSTFVTVSDIFDGLVKITVGITSPATPTTGDLWVDTS